MPAYSPSCSQKQPRTNGSRVRFLESPEYVCSGSHQRPTSVSAAQTTVAVTFGTSATWRRLKPFELALTISARAPVEISARNTAAVNQERIVLPPQGCNRRMVTREPGGCSRLRGSEV